MHWRQRIFYLNPGPATCTSLKSSPFNNFGSQSLPFRGGLPNLFWLAAAHCGKVAKLRVGVSVSDFGFHAELISHKIVQFFCPFTYIIPKLYCKKYAVFAAHLGFGNLFFQILRQIEPQPIALLLCRFLVNLLRYHQIQADAFTLQ